MNRGWKAAMSTATKRRTVTLARVLALLAPLLMLFGAHASTGAMAATSATTFQVRVDATAHQTYGLGYPVTYAFQMTAPAVSAQYRYRSTDPSWTPLPSHTSQDGFNGVPAARFDSASNTAYLSVPFSAGSDD